MKYICLLLLFGLTGNPPAMQIKPINQGSSIGFTVTNLGIDIRGSFSGLEGDIQFDPKNPANTTFNVSVDANTVNTDNGMRDDHLRADTYFDVKKYPRISFVSTKVESSSQKGYFTVLGKLRIKNKTKDISFPFTVEPFNGGYLFKGKFNINREDFGVGGYSIISDRVDLSLSVVARK
jgi:polyisoprenoid-binding protein YceI